MALMGAQSTDHTCVELLGEILLALPGVRKGKMFGYPAFFVGRKLLACVVLDAVGIKVPEDVARRLLEDPRFTPFQPYGKAKMREWVQFPCAPHEGLVDYEDVMLTAYEYVAGSITG